MEQRRLGRTELLVPAVGLRIGRAFHVRDTPREAHCEAVVDTALQCGSNLFDTSPMDGDAERVLALSLADRRHQAVVCTKVWARVRAQGELQIDRALQWFDRIDLYHVHNLLGFFEHLPYLERMQSSGRVGALGVSHYLPSQAPVLIEAMRTGRVHTVHIPYHPLERTAEGELLSAASALDIGVIAAQPFGSGELARLLPSPSDLAPLVEFGVRTWRQALLKWTLSDRRVHAVVPSASTPEQVVDNACAGRPPWFGAAQRNYVCSLAERLAS
jgi:aryl-alcohol dehydrogenase-like predicted oxidoreductase